jgi:purine-binding chemotaxis protein CheW
MSNSNAKSGATIAKAGKYLTFQLGGEIYGIELLNVQEIIGMMAVTHVPRTPDFFRGIINLRGKVIPVIELRRKFGMEIKAETERSCIVVVQVAWSGTSVVMGLLVDEVSEVLTIAADQIENPPSFGSGINTEFILGIGKLGQKVVMLLGVDKVLASEEIAEIESGNISIEGTV